MARDTLQNIQEDIRADLRDVDSETFAPERLEKFLERALRDVSQRQGNPKKIYCTTTGKDKEIDVTEISHDIMRVNRVEFQVDSDTPEYRNAVWNGVNIVEFYTNTTPTRVAIASIADAGSGDITVVCSTVHSMAVGDYVTLTGSTGYDGSYLIKTVPTTLTLTVTATFSATGTGYLGERIRLFYEGMHVLGDTAASNTLSITLLDVVKQGAVAYANMEWVQEFRTYTDQAAEELGSSGAITTALASMLTRIEAALTRLNTGDDLINTIPNWPNAVQDHGSYAHAELAIAQQYFNRIQAYTIDLNGNMNVANLKVRWGNQAWALKADYDRELEKLSFGNGRNKKIGYSRN